MFFRVCTITKLNQPKLLSRLFNCLQFTRCEDGLDYHLHIFFYLLQTGWYNDQVNEHFKLNYPYDTLALCIISTPEMLDKGFKPFLKSGECSGSNDPIDQFIGSCLDRLIKTLPNKEVEIIHDYDLLPSRRPKILVQTAGHVSGGAYYYRRENVKKDPWSKDCKIFGVSIHEKYSGWFGFRGVIILKDLIVPTLQQKPPADVVQGDNKLIELLEKFNYHWKDWRFRDIIPAVSKYSEEQKLYFDTAPGNRHELVKKIIET